MIGINRRWSKQAGIGLLELMLALAIIAILLIMATRYYQATSQSQKVNQAASDIQAILAGYANFRAGNPATAPTTSSLTPFVPQSISGSDGKWTSTNPWGGNYTIATGSQSATSIKIGLKNIPKNACDALASLEAQNMISDDSNCGSGTFDGDFGISTSSGGNTPNPAPSGS